MQRNNQVKKSFENEASSKSGTRIKKKKKKRYIFLKILILILICMIAFMTCALYGYRYIVAGNNQAKMLLTEDNSTVFNIPFGSNITNIADKLKTQGYIENTTVFRVVSKIMGYDDSFRAGNYLITKDMNYYALMIRLSGESLKNPTKDIMIPEGKTLLETVQVLSQQGYIDEKKFLKLCEKGSEQYKFLKNIQSSDERKYLLEGYLYPHTYKMDEGWTEQQLINVMLNEFNRVFKNEYYLRAEELGMTVDEVITLASLIEMEARFPTDYKKISSVFHNRLKSKDLKLLQSDATVQYARVYEGIGRTSSVLYKDLEIESPYNTYKFAGLPPGPICSPRKEAIEAALYPANTKYLYFFAAPDGTNYYNETYNGHLKDQSKFGVSGQ